jgi:hypothetical protein
LKGVEETLTAGDLVVSFGKRAQYLANMRTLIEFYSPLLHSDVTVLFKGFRAA